MAERGYKRPYPGSIRPSAGNSRDRPKSPERVPLHKRLRREADDHPANKLPPSLRGRVTLPGEVKDRGIEDRPPTVDRNTRSDSREQQRRQEQQSSRGRTGDYAGQQPGRIRQFERNRSVDKGPSREVPRPAPAHRAQASRYDMSSATNRTGRGGAAIARFPSNMSSSSHKRPRSPGGAAEHRSTAPGRPPSNSRRSGSPVRPRTVDKLVIRAEDVRASNRSEPARRDGAAARRGGSSRRQQDSRTNRSSTESGQNRNRSAPPCGKTDRRAGRHVSGPEQKSPNQYRSRATPVAAVEVEAPVVDAGVGQLPPPPVDSSEGREEGEALPTPTGAADPAAILLNGQQEQEQQQQQQQEEDLVVTNDVSSPVARLSSAGGSGKHEPIKFTLQKLPAVPVDKLKPKQSSKYSLPSEQQAPAEAQHSAESPQHRRNSHEQQQLAVRSSAGRAQDDPGRAGMSGGGDVVGRSPLQQTGRGRDFSRDGREPPPANSQLKHERLHQVHHRSHEEQQARPRTDQPSRPRQRREVSQDTSRDRSSAGHSSRHQQQDRPADSGRPVASDHSGYRAAASTREQVPPAAVSEAVSPPCSGPAASPARPGPGSRSPPLQTTPPVEHIGVTIGLPLSKADATQHGMAAFGLQSDNPSVMCAEGQSKTSAIQARQAGLVAVQLMGLPISRQLCFKETWEQVCKAARVHPDVLDSEQVACQRRAQAAKAVSARASRNLLMAVNPQRPVPVEVGAEEAHIKHLQLVIDGFADRTAVHNCVHLADGGSLVLPPELKGVIW